MTYEKSSERALDVLNRKLSDKNLHVRVSRLYNYDTNQYRYDTWIEYYNTKRKKWSIYHVLGTFSTESAAMKAAQEKLRMDNIL